MKYLVTLGGRTFEVELLAEVGQVRVNGTVYRAELMTAPGTPLRLLSLEDRSWSIPMENTGPGTWLVQDAGEHQEVEVVDERTAHIRTLAGASGARIGPRPLKAPMPGLVVRVAVEPGQSVVPGASLVVLEAMKMENDLKAPAPGIVEKVAVLPGQTVEKGALLVTFRP